MNEKVYYKDSGMTEAELAALDKEDARFIRYRNEILADWEAAKKQLDAAKELEMELRKKFVSVATSADKISGTENVDLGEGWKAKTVKKVTYKLGSKVEGVSARDAVDAALQKIEALGDEGHFIAERLVKWTADLSLSEYKALDEHPRGPEIKALLSPVLTIDSGAPTLEIVPPKSKK